jgi:hypothetical protein
MLGTCVFSTISPLFGSMEFVIMELDDGAEVSGGASSLSVHQRSGEHHLREAVSTLGKQEGRGEHLWLARRGPAWAGRAHTVQGARTAAVF